MKNLKKINIKKKKEPLATWIPEYFWEEPF